MRYEITLDALAEVKAPGLRLAGALRDALDRLSDDIDETEFEIGLATAAGEFNEVQELRQHLDGLHRRQRNIDRIIEDRQVWENLKCKR